MASMKAYLNLINGTKQDFHVKTVIKQVEDVQAVYIEGFCNTKIDSEFGAGIELAIEGVKSWMADYRHSEFWCRPEFGIDLKDIPDETQGLIYEKADGSYGVILPVVSENYKCVLAGGENGTVLAKLFSWYENMTTCKGLAMINCMGMGSEDMWNRSVSPISRCSDDFQPENREWFIKHILQCAYNCLVQGQFYYCDWDMWWTDDGQAAKNSILRAISGGPVYVSDTYDRSRAEILKPLCLEDGRILRCDKPAVPT